MKRFTDSYFFVAGIPLIFFLMLVAGSESLIYLGKGLWIAREKGEVMKEAGRVRSLLEAEINTTLNLTLGLVIYVASNPEVTQESFEPIARRLMRRTPHIRNVALAKKNVITHIYPLEGNKAALGLRYRDKPKQLPAVLRAIETRRTVVAGPVNLVQGGQGFISRSPIFLDDSPLAYWGLASMVMDVDSLYNASGLLDNSLLRYALKGTGGDQGGVFFGDPVLFTDPDAVQLSIALPVGAWILAAAPYDGVLTYRAEGLVRGVGIGVCLAVSGMLLALLIILRRIRYLAHHDPITDLPNIRYFEAYIKQLITANLYKDEPFALFYIDLEGFKAINESFGHKAGDRVLRDAAQRLAAMASNGSMVCRMAGADFVMVLETIRTPEAAHEKADEMTATLMEEYSLGSGIHGTIDARVGVSLFPRQGVTPEILIREADLDRGVRQRSRTPSVPPEA